MKRRSGVSGQSKSGAQRLKDLGLTKNSKAWKRFKYGSDPAKVVMKIKKKHQPKRRKTAMSENPRLLRLTFSFNLDCKVFSKGEKASAPHKD